ncbi:hypothetical protein pb186bvf_004655 [Paramecium bursaria]
MDSLIEKWKKNTAATLAGSRYSDRKPRKESSSSEESPEQKISNSGIKKSPQQKVSTSLKVLGSSEKKNRKPPTFSAALDTCCYHLAQLHKQQLSQPKLIEQIKLHLGDYAENLQSLGSSGYAMAQVESLQLRIQQYETQISQLKNSNKEDISKRMIAELEEKLLESEKQRIKLKSQKENTQLQMDKIQEQLNKFQISQDLLSQLKHENSILKKNNEVLLVQINQLTQKDKEQQLIWNSQVEDLMNMMDILKKQIQQQT